MIDAYLTGIFPRSEALIAATRGYDRKRVTAEDVEEKLLEDIVSLARLQLEEGFGYTSDGLLNWQDIFRPFVEAWDGLSPGPLTRWFDNNTFFRQPIIVGDIEARPLSGDYFRFDLTSLGKRLKAVLPGPYTFMSLAENRHYRGTSDAMISIAQAMSDVCRRLTAQGYAHLQFSEPSLVVTPPAEDFWSDVNEAYALLRSSTRAELSVQLFFGPAVPITRNLLNLPVDTVGIDIYEEDLKELSDVGFDKGLACGCVDARNSLLESPDEIVRMVSKVEDDLAPPTLVLCPNADLQFLPRTVAERKLRALGGACRELQEEA